MPSNLLPDLDRVHIRETVDVLHDEPVLALDFERVEVAPVGVDESHQSHC